jgi:beta-N-acetylhexosaminidase
MNLTLEQQIGQMLWFGWQGDTPEAALTVSSHARALLEDFQVGGIILMGRNIRDPRQVAGLTTELQAALPVPLFTGIDQEGGKVVRLPLPGLTFAGNMALGAIGDPQAVTSVTAAIGEQLACMGLSVNFAPVLDVNNNPANPVIGVRSFGENPQGVAELGVAALQGFEQARVIACCKHFPGHGDTAVDSHLDLPVQPADRSRLEAVELVPFRAAIAAGTPLLMTAHICFPALDDRWPATISRAILTEMLRGELGYEGVVVTDCLEMSGIAHFFGVEEAALAAIEAGADCLLVCHTLETQRRIHRALLAAAREGRLPAARIEASVERILRLKAEYGLEKRRLADPTIAEQVVGADRFRDLELQIARRAVTVVRDDHGWLPLPAAPAIVTGGDAVATRLVRALRESGIGADAVPAADIEAVAGQTILVVLTATNEECGPALVERWLTGGMRVIVVAAREPYVLADYAHAPCLLATYGEGDACLAALAEVLAGRARCEGRLPVTLVGDRFPRYNA